MNEHPYKNLSGVKRLYAATRNSLNGLITVYSEKAFRLELAVIAILVPFAIFSEKDLADKATLLVVLFNILIVETLNTAIEYTVDRIGLEQNELAKKAKDTASFAVMLSIVIALAYWITIFFFSK
jgi:diacylglycerol kinase (ATP)